MFVQTKQIDECKTAALLRMSPDALIWGTEFVTSTESISCTINLMNTEWQNSNSVNFHSNRSSYFLRDRTRRCMHLPNFNIQVQLLAISWPRRWPLSYISHLIIEIVSTKLGSELLFGLSEKQGNLFRAGDFDILLASCILRVRFSAAVSKRTQKHSIHN